MIGPSLLEIRTAVKAWSQRKNIPDATIDDFINIAATRAVRSLRIPPMEKVVDILIDDDGYVPIPVDFIEAIEMVIVRNGNNIILERKSIHEIDSRYNDSPDTPCYFSRLRENFRLSPYDNPSDTDTVSLYYYATFPPLTADEDCNWVTGNASDLVLYGALSELAAYTRDEESEARWIRKFNEEINRLQGIEDRAAWRGSDIGVTIGGY